ncbi:cytochrome P450 [Streptomyces sp. NPDC096033]|uniref:cytochrome P450 n=1 Tax=Streptomyces sp. NPDC096033 TaxID=3366071 RepID=UPI00381DA0D9
MRVALILLLAVPPTLATAAVFAFAVRPRLAAAYRFRLLTQGDGTADVPMLRIPDQHIHGPVLEELFAHESAGHRGETHARRAILYFHRPADEHQENIDPDHPRYTELARATFRALAVPRDEIAAMARRSTDQVCEDAWPVGTTSRVLRLRDLAVPISARMMFELVFKTAPTREQTALIGRSAAESMRTSKGLRHSRDISARLELLDLLLVKVREHDGCAEFFGRDSTLDTTSRAKHLLGVFFNTGVIQLSESVCHTVLEASRHPHAVARIVGNDPRYLDHVLSEALRLYPLHATIQRLTAADIPLGPTGTIPRGTQLLFDIGRHQRTGHREPDVFIPERWEQRDRTDSGFVGFGLGRRKCPAERFSRTAAATIVQELLSTFAVYAPTRHTRGLEGGGLCYLTAYGSPQPLGSRFKKAIVRTRDHADRLAVGAAQLVCLPLTARAVRRLAHHTGTPPSGPR